MHKNVTTLNFLLIPKLKGYCTPSDLRVCQLAITKYLYGMNIFNGLLYLHKILTKYVAHLSNALKFSDLNSSSQSRLRGCSNHIFFQFWRSINGQLHISSMVSKFSIEYLHKILTSSYLSLVSSK